MRLNDALPVVLLAASDHPDVKFRDHLTEQLERWVSSLKPRYTAEEVKGLLGQCQGTVLEPFALNDNEADIAVLLTRIAFSRKVDQTRFRIVSNQTLGSRGGCVLTNNLKYFYSERFELGKRRRAALNSWRFVPRNRPDIGGALAKPNPNQSAVTSRHLSATAALSENGYEIRVSVPSFSNINWPSSWRLDAMLAQHSYIGSPTESLSNIGISVTTHSNGIRLSPASPEATMRMTAQMLSNRLLVLSPGPGDECAAIIHTRLVLPQEDEQVQLCTLASMGPGHLAEWIKVDIDGGPHLSKEDQLRIAEWTMLPADWVDEELLEAF